MRVLIVDDEPSARRKLAEFLRRERDVEISGEAANGMQAAELIDELQPDVVFLDVQMPGMNGSKCSRRFTAAFRSSFSLPRTINMPSKHSRLMRSITCSSPSIVTAFRPAFPA